MDTAEWKSDPWPSATASPVLRGLLERLAESERKAHNLSKLQTCEKAPTEPATTLKSQRPCVSAKGFIRELKSEPKEPEALCECKR